MHTALARPLASATPQTASCGLAAPRAPQRLAAGNAELGFVARPQAGKDGKIAWRVPAARLARGPDNPALDALKGHKAAAVPDAYDL